MRLALSIIIALASIVALSRADELGDAQRRMKERLGQVVALKESGALGENNRGYLELREGDTAAGRVAEAENSDRRILYGIVAKRTGESVETVGRQRAAEIARSSRPGIWLQDANGRWYQK